MLISGNTVQWHNLQWDVPGITSDDEGKAYNYPTTIATVDMGTVDWYPLWAGGTSGEQYSDIYDGLNQPLLSGGPITLTVIEQREEGMVSIFQMPDINNNYTLIVKFDDAAPPGAAWYEIELNNANPVPLPGAIWLLSSGLIGLVGLGRKKQKYLY